MKKQQLNGETCRLSVCVHQLVTAILYICLPFYIVRCKELDVSKPSIESNYCLIHHLYDYHYYTREVPEGQWPTGNTLLYCLQNRRRICKSELFWHVQYRWRVKSYSLIQSHNEQHKFHGFIHLKNSKYNQALGKTVCVFCWTVRWWQSTLCSPKSILPVAQSIPDISVSPFALSGIAPTNLCGIGSEQYNALPQLLPGPWCKAHLSPLIPYHFFLTPEGI